MLVRVSPVVSRSMLLVTITLFGIAAPGAAQTPDPASWSEPRVAVGPSAGLGNGPSRSGTLGLDASVRLTDWFAISGEYSAWESGVGVSCIQMIPDSYLCSVSGRTLLAGASLRWPISGPATPYAEILGGTYRRDERVSSTALGVAAGLQIRVARRWILDIRGRYLRSFDDAYEEFLDEDLEYRLVTLGLKFGLGL